jgi:hypothetical protein
MHETFIDHFYTLERNQNISSHWANFCLRNFFLSVCSSLYSFIRKFYVNFEVWKKNIHSSISIFLSYLYFTSHYVYKMTFNVTCLFESGFTEDGRSVGVPVRTRIQLTWEYDFKCATCMITQVQLWTIVNAYGARQGNCSLLLPIPDNSTSQWWWHQDILHRQWANIPAAFPHKGWYVSFQVLVILII